jgi:hypothetical protein
MLVKRGIRPVLSKERINDVFVKSFLITKNETDFVSFDFDRNILLILLQKVVDRWREVVRLVVKSCELETSINELTFTREAKLYSGLCTKIDGQ